MPERRKESRLSVDLPGTYQRPGCNSHAMFFSQLSSKGCCLSARTLILAIGDAVELYLGPIGPIEATVRWTRPDSAGIEFDAALEPALVSYFAAFITDAA